MPDLQEIAEQARQYCLTQQVREFDLDGACHENVVGALDYIRLSTRYNPILIWGVVLSSPDSSAAETVQDVSERHTHFWAELAGYNGIIDPHTVSPLGMDDLQTTESKTAYGGPQPELYQTVERFRCYGPVRPFSLTHKSELHSELERGVVERISTDEETSTDPKR